MPIGLVLFEIGEVEEKKIGWGIGRGNETNILRGTYMPNIMHSNSLNTIYLCLNYISSTLL